MENFKAGLGKFGVRSLVTVYIFAAPLGLAACGKTDFSASSATADGHASSAALSGTSTGTATGNSPQPATGNTNVNGPEIATGNNGTAAPEITNGSAATHSFGIAKGTPLPPNPPAPPQPPVPPAVPLSYTYVDLDHTTWTAVGTGDFNHSAVSETLFQDPISGEVGYWTMSGGLVQGFIDLGNAGTYRVVALADLNGDGTTDVLFQDPGSRDVGYWQINPNANSTGNGTPLSTLNFIWVDLQATATWSVVGTGDFNHDGTIDVLFKDSATNQVGYWAMAGGQIRDFIVLGTAGTYGVVAVGDFNGDGTSDIVFQDPVSHDVGYWLVNPAASGNGSSPIPSGNVTWVDLQATAWSVVAVGDLGHDGTLDIVFQDGVSGEVGYWAMSGGQIQKFVDLGPAGTYRVITLGDFTGSAALDILFQDPKSHDVGYWSF